MKPHPSPSSGLPVRPDLSSRSALPRQEHAERYFRRLQRWVRTARRTLQTAPDHRGLRYYGSGESGWGAQLGAQINVPNSPGSSLRVLAFYADSDNAYNPHGGQWSVLGSYGHQINGEWFVSLAGQYTDKLYFPGTDVETDYNRWDVEAYATWQPVENFQIMSEEMASLSVWRMLCEARKP